MTSFCATQTSYENRDKCSKVELTTGLGDDLEINLNCDAPYPIKWEIIGIIIPLDMIEIETKRSWRNIHNFKIKMRISLYVAMKHQDRVSSAKLRCVKISDVEIHSSASLFIPGLRATLVAKTDEVQDSRIIPCLTTNPNVIPQLFVIGSDNAEKKVGDVVYDMTEGFYSEELFNENFTCKHGSDYVIIQAIVQRDYHFFPKSANVFASYDEAVGIKCVSEINLVWLTIEEIEGFNVIVINETETFREMSIAVAGVNVDKIRLDSYAKASVSCYTKVLGVEKILHTWTINFHYPPAIEIIANGHPITYKGIMYCQVGVFRNLHFTIKTVPCKNIVDCEVKKLCLAGDCKGIEESNDGVIFHSNENFIAQCTNLNGSYSWMWDYFLSLDSITYNDWKKASSRELVRMDEIAPILYSNQTNQFVCVALAYLFADLLVFEVDFRNGSRYVIDDTATELSGNISYPDHFANPRSVPDFNVFGVLDIILPVEAVAVHCNALWLNSTDVVKASRHFETRYLQLPAIKSSGRVSKEFFYEDEKSRLTCFSSGEPEVVYSWLFKDGIEYKNALNVFPELRTSLSSGQGYLEFDNVEKKYSGEYKCVVKNELGDAEKNYILKVADAQISRKTIITISAISLFVFVGAIVGLIFVLAVLWKRYKNNIRDLTEMELEEFRNGNLDLITDSPETVEFLPYKTEYEVPGDDFEFDNSENGFLGSGQFSYVIKCRIKSRLIDVAVKITKPTMDVDLFKSLLSEIKIMIYVGKHRNILGLVCACTEKIQNRKVYIASEICELGSLESYINKKKASFINLNNSNHEIDGCSLTASDYLSTLDLIYFAQQIANGMDYLANKSVIHADLAARNVLLTSQKIAKISDFGLSKKLYTNTAYVKKTKCHIPWRWMAPESLTSMIFSTSTDVWSYGVTLFELFTLGEKPFPNYEFNTDFILKLEGGMRMGRPQYSSLKIYSMINRCWEASPESRPTFLILKTYFESLLTKYKYEIPGESDYDTL